MVSHLPIAVVRYLREINIRKEDLWWFLYHRLHSHGHFSPLLQCLVRQHMMGEGCAEGKLPISWQLRRQGWGERQTDRNRETENTERDRKAEMGREKRRSGKEKRSEVFPQTKHPSNHALLIHSLHEGASCTLLVLLK